MATVERIRCSFLRHCRSRCHSKGIYSHKYSLQYFRKFRSLLTQAVQETVLFPELAQETHCKRTLLSIDPDSNGAITAFTWNARRDGDDACAQGLLRTADIQVFDMPTETWQLRTREKKRPSPKDLVNIFRSFQDGESIVRVAVESSTPTHLSGKFAWYDSGFSSGMLHGIFEALNLPSEGVPVSSWKKDLGLVKLGKAGSLELARILFKDQKEVYLTRKKDHGRAESMLIGAWALGLRPELVDSWPDIQAILEESS